MGLKLASPQVGIFQDPKSLTEDPRPQALNLKNINPKPLALNLYPLTHNRQDGKMRLDDPDSSPAAWAVSQFLHLGPGSRHRVFQMSHNLNSLNRDYIEDYCRGC